MKSLLELLFHLVMGIVNFAVMIIIFPIAILMAFPKAIMKQVNDNKKFQNNIEEYNALSGAKSEDHEGNMKSEELANGHSLPKNTGSEN